MDWLRNNSIRSLSRQQPRLVLNTDEECDLTACYDSFKEHWLQAFKIIQRSQQLPTQDEVLEVVNHLEQMVTLLLYNIKKMDQTQLPLSSASHCLEHLINENILEKLFEWGMRTGKYSNVVRLEQLKLYEMVIAQSRHLLLVHESFLRPMLKLLKSYQGNVFTKETDKKLVGLLYRLCVLLMQNVSLLDLFFLTEEGNAKFIIFSLLIDFVHYENSVGMQARDALLLCMTLSKKSKNVGKFISEKSNIYPILASGLSGLYSRLPQELEDIVAPDWHRLTPDDVNDIKDLSTFVTSLEFANAVAQVSHPVIRRQLQEFLYMGFLIPVLGPALLQSTVGEKIAATAYLELILRTVTHPGLLYPLLQFLIQQTYDGQRLLHILIQRINSDDNLCLITLALFETMVEINCEDLMLELVFQYLQPCLHLMLSQRQQLLPLDPHCQSFQKLLMLAPSCCDGTGISPKLDGRNVQRNQYGSQQSLYGNFHAYLCDARSKIAACELACSHWNNTYTGCDSATTQDPNLSESANSLPSLGESSGYESLKFKLDDSTEDTPVWQISQNDSSSSKQNNFSSGQLHESSEQLGSACTAGPFLTTVLGKLNTMTSNSLYVNLHLTGLISRLAVYSQPLLRTYLLDSSLVLQPDVPSLFQIIGSTKQKIDEYMKQQSDSLSLLRQARTFLQERETRLMNARRNIIENRNSIASTTSTDSYDPFQRNGPKRRSFTSSLSSFSNMFTRKVSHAEPSIQLISPPEDSVNLLYHPRFSETQRVALCAVILDEWVKELAALAQEHTIAQLTALFK
ncbi:hypothetical protein FQR65_LT02968 [Abscondita terminalis]|nr:hypothetical protein FQR65_LT02968 [Abscondita terminalis]